MGNPEGTSDFGWKETACYHAANQERIYSLPKRGWVQTGSQWLGADTHALHDVAKILTVSLLPWPRNRTFWVLANGRTGYEWDQNGTQVEALPVCSTGAWTDNTIDWTFRGGKGRRWEAKGGEERYIKRSRYLWKWHTVYQRLSNVFWFLVIFWETMTQGRCPLSVENSQNFPDAGLISPACEGLHWVTIPTIWWLVRTVNGAF